jgi:DNA primase
MVSRIKDMPGRIRQNDIDEVKSRTNIADIIGEYVTLKSAGVGSLKGLCPFHDEKSPSFHVRPHVGYYHCFGCGESGDVLTFIQRMDHVTFAESVERLAQRAAFPLHYEDGDATPEHGNRSRILAANAEAADFFAAHLARSSAEIARTFLGQRGFDAAAAAHFGVGFAPKSWNELTKHLQSRGFTEDELVVAGLVSSGDRGIYDRFRGRLVWPIRDITGQTVGFGARKLFDDDSGPKYLNTPETPVYHKAHVLYGLDLAKRNISREQQVVIVEGYTDVMACHLAGVNTAVATCGTSFGVDHIKVLRRVIGDDSGAGEVIFTFDPDTAGQKAAIRAFTEERRFSSQTFVAIATEGLDPCDLRLQRGDDAVQRLIQSKKPMFEFMIRQTLTRYDLDTVEGRVGALRAAAPVIAGIRDPAVRPGYTRELARLLGCDLDEVRRTVAAANFLPSKQQNTSFPQPSSGPNTLSSTHMGLSLIDLPSDPLTRLERDSLMAILQYPLLVGTELAYRALQCAFMNPALVDVRNALATAFPHVEAPNWFSHVVDAAPEALRPLIQQLAVAPIPERSEAEMGTYARGVVSSLVDRDLMRCKTELLGRLQRTNPTNTDLYRDLQREIVCIESNRRALRDE